MLQAASGTDGQYRMTVDASKQLDRSQLVLHTCSAVCLVKLKGTEIFSKLCILQSTNRLRLQEKGCVCGPWEW